MCDEVYVTMKVHENATGKQQSIPVTLFVRPPNPGTKEGSHVKLGKFWRVDRVGDYMELYGGTPITLIDMALPYNPLQGRGTTTKLILFDQRLFIYTASHEIGHSLGLWEAYGLAEQTPQGVNLQRKISNEVPEYDIMRGFQGDGLFSQYLDLSDREYTSNDMEMILEAWKMNVYQFFYPVPTGEIDSNKQKIYFPPSSVILMK